MKNVFIFLLLGFLLFFAFSGVGTAEEAGDKELVYKVFDSSYFLIGGTEQYFPFRSHNELDYDLDFNNEVHPWGGVYLDKFLKCLNETLKTKVEGYSPSFSILDDGRIVIRCRKEDVSKAEKVYAMFLPKQENYNLQILLFSGKNVKDNGYGKHTFDSMSSAINVLTESGYEARLDSHTSLSPNKQTFIEDCFRTNYVGDYEGLVATAAALMDPVILDLNTGTGLILTLRETGNKISLDMRVTYATSATFETIHVNRLLVEKPDFNVEEFKQTLSLSANSVCSSRFTSNGEDHVLLVKIEK